MTFRKALLLLTLLLTFDLTANSFGNNGVSLPRIGATFFDQSLIPHQKPWGIDQQWSLGTAFRSALNYRWWWIAETDFAMGSLTNTKSAFLSSVLGGTGIRYCPSTNDLRPYASLMLHYLQFLGDNARLLPLDIDWPIWVGLKPGFGLEWFIYSEMALSLEAAYAFYVNLKEPFRHALFLNASFALYF